MKRKTLTLSSEFYEKLIHLEPETKHGVLDVVFDFFFAGKSFCYSDFSTDTKKIKGEGPKTFSRCLSYSVPSV